MVKFSMFSDSGSRDNNEDNIGMYQDGESYCFILADGLGGHGKGEVASQIAVESSILRFAEMKDREDFLGEAFEHAQAAITSCQERDRSCADMKTTLVALQIDEHEIRWGHIGDSRLYYFQRNKLKERTLDHSVPQMLVSVGKLKEKDGFWELIEEKKMEALLKKADTPEQWIRLMQEVILKNGRNTDMDNYSAIAVWLE